METFTIKFKTVQSNKPLAEKIEAKDIKEAMQKLKTLHQNALIVSFMQM